MTPKTSNNVRELVQKESTIPEIFKLSFLNSVFQIVFITDNRYDKESRSSFALRILSYNIMWLGREKYCNFCK